MQVGHVPDWLEFCVKVDWKIVVVVAYSVNGSPGCLFRVTDVKIDRLYSSFFSC